MLGLEGQTTGLGPEAGEMARPADELEPTPEIPAILDQGKLELKGEVSFEEVVERLRKIEIAGVTDSEGQPVQPYADATFTLATVYPDHRRGGAPMIRWDSSQRTQEETLWTPQPTIYSNQTKVIERVHAFLSDHGIDLLRLSGAVDYSWEKRGDYTILPPVIETQVLPFKDGYINLDEFAQRFQGLYLPDGNGNLHNMTERYLNGYFIDEVESLDHFDIFNPNLQVLNFGLQENSRWQYRIICDGSHRIDFALEVLGEPIQVILVDAAEGATLYPYYALPQHFTPTTRLSSKKAEEYHPNLARDKVHILGNTIRKSLHFNWQAGGLAVSSLRAAQK